MTRSDTRIPIQVCEVEVFAGKLDRTRNVKFRTYSVEPENMRPITVRNDQSLHVQMGCAIITLFHLERQL